MAKRKFNLPGIQDLSKSQEDARALPKDGQHLIIGGPGTGKSVLALLRARRYHRDKDDYVFLVYNKLLHQASGQLFGEDLYSQQWQSWFEKTFRTRTNEAVPKLPAKSGTGWREVDWPKIAAMIGNVSGAIDASKFPYLIIDEGQDMPPQFYESLVNFGFENFFVAADQNQQIVPDQNSTRQEISDALSIEPDDVIELCDNYRNTYPIARLAREFYTGDPASPPPQLPARAEVAKKPILLQYKETQFDELIGRVLKMADLDPSKLVGVITPDNKVRERYFNALNNNMVKLDHEKSRIRTYKKGMDASPLLFDEGGIMIINAQSCKGLEFDAVILADIHKHFCRHDLEDQKKRLFYVMVARAIDTIIMLKGKDEYSPIDAILPKDNEIMEWK